MSLLRGALVLAAVLLLPACARSAAGFRETSAPDRDGFAFWGFTVDGKRFIYEIYEPASGGPAACADEVALLLYDAAADKLIPEGELRIPSGGQDETGKCRIPDVRAVLDGERGNQLEQHGIVAGKFFGPSRFDPTPEGGFAVALGNARIGYAQLTELPQAPPPPPPPPTEPTEDELAEPTEDEPAEPAAPPPPAASWQLTITLDGSTPRNLTLGPHPGAVSATLQGALAFTDPKQNFAALCVPVTFKRAEGTHTSWDCHGLFLR